jgi:hypothetical protein
MSKRRASAREATPGPQNRVVQLKITLQGVDPPIWRRVQIPATLSLAELHEVIQAAMGWEDCHLHQFLVGRVYYSGPALDGFDVGWDDDMEDERKVALGDLVTRKGQRFLYEYDMGDGWGHQVLAEKLLDAEEGINYPVCTGGKRACPPEDCGGVWGYEHLLEALADPDHPDHADMLEWAGEIDPAAFDLDPDNERLEWLR